jgi:hypothetical protein
MPYTTSVTVDGPPQKAVTVLRDALLANAFTITEASQTGFTAIGPGMNSTNQNAIRGVSKATFHAEGKAIHVTAELGGAAWIGRFAIFFPLGLGVVWAIAFGMLWWPKHRDAVIVPLLVAAPWLLLGPLMARMVRRRTEQAIEALLQSAASIS